MEIFWGGIDQETTSDDVCLLNDVFFLSFQVNIEELFQLMMIVLQVSGSNVNEMRASYVYKQESFLRQFSSKKALEQEPLCYNSITTI